MSDNTIRTGDNIEIYENEIYLLCDEFINGLRDPDEIYTNKRLVAELFKYIYKNYVSKILNNNYKNGNRYNIYTLDMFWDIYTSIAHRYNCNATILLFLNMVNVSRDSINRWKNNIDRELTPDESAIVKKWYRESELDLVQGSSVFDIFMLKSNFMYNDQLVPLPLEAQNVRIDTEKLPNLEGSQVEGIPDKTPKPL